MKFIKRKTSLRKRLQLIYTAKQCCDVSDVQQAIKEVKDLITYFDGMQTPSIRNRLRSLETRLTQLQK